nr:hypothetical protein [Lysinibacillus timonensis]
MANNNKKNQQNRNREEFSVEVNFGRNESQQNNNREEFAQEANFDRNRNRNQNDDNCENC